MDFKKMYGEKLKTPEEIAETFSPGYKVMSDIALASPHAVLNAVCRRVKEKKLSDIYVHGCLDIYPYEFFREPAAAGEIHYVSWFSNGFARKLINQGRADVMPGSYHMYPGLIDDYVEFDAVLAAVSPMDEHGYFSFGLDGSITEALMRKSKRIILEVNSHMPRCVCGPLVHISNVDMLCENDEPLIEMPETEADETSLKIGRLIAEEIPDGACLQLGIGSIPDAVGYALKGKKHLGLHTEMLTSSMIDLIECGAVDNTRKSVYPGRTLATFGFGSRRIYDYVDNNPAVAILPADYVNDPAVIARNDNMISVNSAIEVDLYGQVSAESAGTKHISGSGGHEDYVRGAVMSKGGKSFIAMTSTARDRKTSRIVPALMRGSIVTTGKNEVDYVVTEYGIAKLRGKTAGQRAKALINIAHPEFRGELRAAAAGQHIMV
jgi:Acetyl-CoA hydrolase